MNYDDWKGQESPDVDYAAAVRGFCDRHADDIDGVLDTLAKLSVQANVEGLEDDWGQAAKVCCDFMQHAWPGFKPTDRLLKKGTR